MKLFIGLNFFLQAFVIVSGDVLVLFRLIDSPMPRISLLHVIDLFYLLGLTSFIEKLGFLKALKSKFTILLLMIVNFLQLPPFYFNFFRFLSPFRNLYTFYWPGGVMKLQEKLNLGDGSIAMYGLMGVPYLFLFWNLSALGLKMYRTENR